MRFEWTAERDATAIRMARAEFGNKAIALALGCSTGVVNSRLQTHRDNGVDIPLRTKGAAIVRNLGAVEFFLANPFGGSAYVAGDPETTIPAVNAMLAEGYTMLEGKAHG